MTTYRIPETPGVGRLGRHIEHDERSRAFAVAEPADLSAIPSVAWTRRSPIFDQGDVGACTGNAMAGVIGTDSLGRTGSAGMTEEHALQLYELATRLDSFPGHYQPDDTGSSGVAAAKAAKKLGYITGYRHAFSLAAALHALQSGPCLVGMSWLTGCDKPDSTGLVEYVGSVRGGHEIELREYDAARQLVKLDNSWSITFGAQGSFWMSVPDFGLALRNGGDVTVPTFRPAQVS